MCFFRILVPNLPALGTQTAAISQFAKNYGGLRQEGQQQDAPVRRGRRGQRGQGHRKG